MHIQKVRVEVFRILDEVDILFEPATTVFNVNRLPEG